MLSATPSLHHVTGVVGDFGACAEFYGETLGLCLLRWTVNYEDRHGHRFRHVRRGTWTPVERVYGPVPASSQFSQNMTEYRDRPTPRG